MNLLLVEDDYQIRKIISEHCSSNGISLSIGTSTSEAIELVDGIGSEFDLVICDLKLPSGAGLVDEDVEHGLFVLRHILSTLSGVPVIVLSAFGTVDVVSKMLYDARQVDIYGKNTVEPMLRFVQKAKLVDAVEGITKVHRELSLIEQIELYAPDLTEMYKRAIKVFARRKGGGFVEYKSLAGGRSGARTGLATVKTSTGAQTAHAVSKLTRMDRAVEEKERYRAHIAGKLSAATYADLNDEVVAGCGGAAGLFYSVADSFKRDLFSILREKPEDAGRVVEELALTCAPWLTGVPHASKTWKDIRQTLIGDRGYFGVMGEYPIVQISDDRAVQCIWTSQHGDLHGSNVLVDETLRPVMIDYGRAGHASNVLDPLTLELSAVFHPDSPFRDDIWPSVADLENWAEVDAYLRDCPYRKFIEACRRWTLSVKVGQRDLFATVNAFCLRNLQYDDVDKEKALALQKMSGDRVNTA